MVANLSEHSGDLLVRQSLHELAKFVPLSTHRRHDTARRASNGLSRHG
jgi:hypothetical protein